jgi:hypothetical protein
MNASCLDLVRALDPSECHLVEEGFVSVVPHEASIALISCVKTYFKRIPDAVEITIPKLTEMATEQVELASVPFATFINTNTRSRPGPRVVWVVAGSRAGKPILVLSRHPRTFTI